MTEYARIVNGQIAGFVDLIDVAGSQIGPHPSGKPYLLPVQTMQPPFDPVTQVREGPSFSIEGEHAVRRYTVRDKNAAEIEGMRNNKILMVRNEGTRRLEILHPLAAQIQAITRLVQLIYINTDRSAWPAPQQQLATAMLARLQNIQNVRQVEDTKIGEINALTTPQQIAAYDVMAGW